jgi:hypothetical protein
VDIGIEIQQVWVHHFCKAGLMAKSAREDGLKSPQQGSSKGSTEMQKHSNFDASWPVAIIIGVLLVFTFALTGSDQVKANISSSLRSLHSPVTVAPAERSQVLVVTKNKNDENRIVLTVNPRGYQIIAADTVELAKAILRANANRIGVVVVDADLKGAGSLLSQAHSILPNEKVINLSRSHTSTDVAVLLLAAI